MSVSFKPATTTPTEITSKLFSLEHLFKSTDDLIRYKQGASGEILRTSPSSDTLLQSTNNNGLVNTLTRAYNVHHNVILRPEDFWVSVLTQFSNYVNGSGESIRDRFVDFQGQKELTVKSAGNIRTADFGAMSVAMTCQIAANLKDASVREWVLPDFTTTKPNDTVVCSIVMMAAMQNFFSYRFELCCGIPQVTLLGTPEDYQKLSDKVNRLLEFDNGSGVMKKWHALLRPIFDELLRASQNRPDLEFWNKVCSRHGGGSGPSYLSGWVTAFCCFDEKGKWRGDQREVNIWGETVTTDYPIVDTNDIPSGLVSVPVLLNDNGVEYKTKMIAGSFTSEVIDSTTLAPRLDWIMAVDDDSSKPTKPRW